MPTLGTKLNGPASASASSTSFHAAWTEFKAPRSGTNRFGPKLAVPWFAAFPTASSSLQMNVAGDNYLDRLTTTELGRLSAAAGCADFGGVSRVLGS